MAINTPKGLTKNNTLEISQNVKNILKVLQNNSKDITKGKGRGKDDSKDSSESKPKTEEEKKKEKEEALEKIAQEHLEETKKFYEKNENTIASTILGPLRMITAPLDKFTNGFLSKSVKSALFGGQKGKTNPNKQDVVKMGAIGSGFLYIAKIMDKVEDEKKDSIFEKIGNFFKEKIGGLLGKFGNFLGTKLGELLFHPSKFAKKMGRIGGGLALAGGAVMMGVDAHKGTQQDWKDKEGKQLSKGVKGAGALLGGIGSGFQGAFANMGKWALTGFGIGNLIMPGIGGIVGGAIGGLLGGILGFIGGEKLAQGIQAIGNWFKDTFWPALKNFGIKIWEVIKDLFGINKLKEIWSGDDNTLVKVLKTITTGLITYITFPIKKILCGAKFIANFVKNTKFGKAVGQFMGSMMNTTVGKKIGNALATAKSGIAGIQGIFDHAFDGVKWDKDKGFLNNMKDITSTIFNNIKNGITDFFKNNPLGKWLDDKVIKPIRNALGSIGFTFQFIQDTFTDAGGGLGGLKAVAEAFTQETEFVGNVYNKKKGRYEMVKETKYQKGLREYRDSMQDGIIRPNGDVIKTNPKDTLIALKDIDTSFRSVRQESNASSIQGFDSANVSTIINLLKRIAEKDTSLKLPQQTRYDIDILMNGGLA